MARPRWILHLQAQMWRFLMGIGMRLHRAAYPWPPKPTFTRRIKSTVSGIPGSFDLNFYVPKDYELKRRMGFKSRDNGPGFPVVVNFHGGGFTLGTSHDDARWIATVVDECSAVVVSVEYRLAPECPFPTAVEDGVDAVLWVAEHADELGLDANRIALSGFSSGGNMSFTVPLRLYDHMTGFAFGDTSTEDLGRSPAVVDETTNAASSSSLNLGKAKTYRLDDLINSTRNTKAPSTSVRQAPSVSICAIVPWYPSTDYTRTREQRRTTSIRKDQDLPALFTDLFDESYLHPPDTIPLDSPYLSPGIASSAHLRSALPKDIIMHTCQWDMLLKEGEEFHERLISDEIGKRVVYKMVEAVPHGWDKAPNPIKPTPGVKQYYLKACEELRRVFGDRAPIPDLDRKGRRRRSVVN